MSEQEKPTPIWEWSARRFAMYRREMQKEYDLNALLRDLNEAVYAEPPDKDLVVKLARKYMVDMIIEDSPAPPKVQPCNRREAMAELKRGEKLSVLSKVKTKDATK